MEDVPWHYVAMIFIAFVSWLYSRIQEAAEARRRKAASRKAAAETRRAGTQPPPSPYRPAPRSPETRAPSFPGPRQPTSAPAPTQPAQATGPRTIREFNELERESAEGPAELDDEPWIEVAQPARDPMPSAPPPLPVAQRPAASAPPSPVAPRAGQSPLARTLAARGPLRQAVILKEILDDPIALRAR